MTTSFPEGTLAAAKDCFPSLIAMRDEHHALLKRRKEAGTEDVRQGIRTFLARGCATGALLDSSADRRDAQSMLDYWAAESYRVGQEVPDATLDDYEPGQAQALVGAADALYERLDSEDQLLVRRILLHLLRPTVAGGVIRNRTVRQALLPLGRPDRVERVLQMLVDTRLVHRIPGKNAADDQFEVAYEVLARTWARFEHWLADERDQLRRRQRLRAGAELWREQGEDPGALLSDTQLAQIAGYTDLNELERKYIEISRERAERIKRERREQAEALEKKQRQLEEEHRKRQLEAEARRLWRLFAFILFGLLVAAAGTAVFAVVMWNRAVTATRIAKEEKEKANAATQKEYRQAQVHVALDRVADAIVNLEIDPQQSVALALEAVEMIEALEGPRTPKEELAYYRARDALYKAVQTSRLRLKLTGHTGTVNGVTFSRDGKRLATASADRTVRVWDVASDQASVRLIVNAQGKEFPEGHADIANDLAFDPEGKLLATASDDQTAKVWDVSAGKARLLHTLRDHGDEVWGVAFSPQGKLLATAGRDMKARVYEVASDKVRLVHTLTGHDAAVGAVTFSPDGARIATVSDDRTARVWDVATGKELLALRGHTGGIVGVSLDPEGKHLATASRDGTAKVWDLAAGKEVLTLRGHLDVVMSVAFSPRGARLATASQDGTAKVWDAATGRELVTLRGHTGGLRGVAFSPDGTRLATSSFDATVRLWDTSPSWELLTLTSNTDWVYDVAFDPAGKRLATASKDRTARVWDTASGQVVSYLFEPSLWTLRSLYDPSSRFAHAGSIHGIAYSPDGKYLATAGADHMAKVWDAASGQLLYPLTDLGLLTWRALFDPSRRTTHDGVVHGVAFGPGGKLATAGGDHTAKVWDLSAAELKPRTLSGHTNRVFSVAFSPDGTHLATASADSTAKVWDLTAKELKPRTLARHKTRVYGVAFNPAGTHLATASEDGKAMVWDLHAGENGEPRILHHPAAVHGVSFSKAGTCLITVCDDKITRVWDLQSSREWPVLTLSGHSGPARKLAVSQKGDSLATASFDTTVRLYNLDVDALDFAAVKVQAKDHVRSLSDPERKE